MCSIEQLEERLSHLSDVHYKLILLIGERSSAKRLLKELALRHSAAVVGLGSELGERLAMMPLKVRGLSVTNVLDDLAAANAAGDLLLLDNLEILFDCALNLNPLDLLRRMAHRFRVVAVWPGQVREARLMYAEMGHPEHREYALQGLTTIQVE